VNDGRPRWRLRVCYSISGRLRFISHLDFIRTFERAVRRAGLPVALSQGYSPAPRIAYGWPLPVGTAGLAEYVDVELRRRVSPEEAAESLNQALPEDIRVRDARYVSPHGPSLMAELDTAAYLVRVPAAGLDLGDWRRAAERLLARRSLEVVRERGGGGGKPARRRVVDTRPLIRSLEVREMAGGEIIVFMELAHSDRGTARPEEVTALLAGEAGREAAASPASVVRLGLRCSGGGL